MNKGELISTYATITGTKPGEAKTAVENFARIFHDVLLEGDEVTIPGVGKLKVRTKAARAGRNPATGEAIQIPSKNVVEFTPSAEFKDKVSPVE